jgi:hypothetical protein
MRSDEFHNGLTVKSPECPSHGRFDPQQRNARSLGGELFSSQNDSSFAGHAGHGMNWLE